MIFDVKVDFQKNILNMDSDILLVKNDYNSTKFLFDFDTELGRKVFELKKPNGSVWIKDIINNEITLVDYENDEIIPVINQAGTYEFEIVVYDNNSKLTTSPIGYFIARDEIVNVDNDIIESDARLPILDDLINDVNTAVTETNNLNLDIETDEIGTKVVITKKDGIKEETYVSSGGTTEHDKLTHLEYGNTGHEDSFDKIYQKQEVGRGLSTNDFTNDDKKKLDSLYNYDDTKLRNDVDNKQDKLVSGNNIKTINGESLLGSGNIVIEDGGTGGTSDYEDLDNKPKINDVELVGNKTLEDLGILEPLIGSVDTLTSPQVKQALFEGRPLAITFPVKISGVTIPMIFNNWVYVPELEVLASSINSMVDGVVYTFQMWWNIEGSQDYGYLQTTIPDKTSQLENDSDFTTKEYVDKLIGDIGFTIDTINGEVI